MGYAPPNVNWFKKLDRRTKSILTPKYRGVWAIVLRFFAQKKDATSHDQQARFTFTNPSPKTKAPLNAKD